MFGGSSITLGIGPHSSWQYFEVFGYTMHDYLFAQKVAVIRKVRSCFEYQLGEMRTSWRDGLMWKVA